MSHETPSLRTAVSVLTPAGRGAVAVVRLWGPRALAIADAAFRPARGRSLASTRPRRLRLGRVGAGLGDEVVAVNLGSDPPSVEVHTHGGPSAVSLVVDALVALGAELRPPAHSVALSATSRLMAEAEIDLASAPTLRVAEVLLDQLNGALDADLETLLGRLESGQPGALGLLDALIARAEVGCRLTEGWRIALAGRPNVGKSRLLNALAGYERAIVDPTPGTTRDVLTVRTALGGWPVELADTAGVRATAEAIEEAGIAEARALHARADLVLLVLDRSQPLTDADRDLSHDHAAALRVANKCDLPAAWGDELGDVTVVSAQDGTGIESLAAVIEARLVPDAPPAGVGVPFRPGHVRRLTAARDALGNGAVSDARAELAALRTFGSEG